MGLTGTLILCASLILIAIFSHCRVLPQQWISLMRTLTHIQTTLLCVTVISLAFLLLTGAYEFVVVFDAVENAMPAWQRLGGLWSGQAGSLLFFSFVLSCAASFAVELTHRKHYANAIRSLLLPLEVTLLFFLIPAVLISNPFLKTWMKPSGAMITSLFPPTEAALVKPIDGQGMNPSLRHIAMLLHPPALYLGLVGFFLPYAYALASLAEVDHSPMDSIEWVKTLYPFVLTAWMFLSIGMLLGSWWAYDILGWGGYWGWDAVEISGLLPWLLSFGLLHSMRMHLHGAGFQRWVYFFVFSIVLLTLFGILITRSGILESIHAYTSGTMGPMLTILISMHILAIIILLITRRSFFIPQDRQLNQSLTAKLMQAANLTLVGLVFIYLFGQTLPLTSRIFFGETRSFSPAQYEKLSAPLLILLLTLMALCPLAARYNAQPRDYQHTWKRLLLFAAVCPLILTFVVPFRPTMLLGFWAAAFTLISWLYAFLKDKKKIDDKSQRKAKLHGSPISIVLIHLGLIILAFGILGVENFSESFKGELLLNEPFPLSGVCFQVDKYESVLEQTGNPNFNLDVRVLGLKDSPRVITASILHYYKLGSVYARPAVLPGLWRDIQVILEEVPPTGSRSFSLTIRFFPLMSWVWAGGALMCLGGMIGVWSPRGK